MNTRALQEPIVCTNARDHSMHQCRIMSLFIVQWGGGPKVTPGQHILTANTRDVLHPIASTRAVHQPIVSTSARRTGQSEHWSSARGSAAQGVLARKRKKRSPPYHQHQLTCTLTVYMRQKASARPPMPQNSGL